jgi:hypothetical protein
MSPYRQNSVLVGIIALAVVVANLSAAPAPHRSLKDDQALMAQTGKGETWVATSDVEGTRDRKKVSIRCCFIITKDINSLTLADQENFRKKGGVLGILTLGTIRQDGTDYSFYYYRLEEKDDKRLLVITGNKPNEEITFEYKLDEKVLKLKGGEKVITECGLLDIAGEYKKQDNR